MNHVVVLGAGSVGCYLGGCLAAAGVRVSLLGRASLMSVVAQQGLQVTDCDGRDHRLRPSACTATTDPAVLATADWILVTVKSADTAAAADLIARWAPPEAVVLSLQNGVQNPDVLQQALPAHCVVAGMVPYNILQLAPGVVHRGSAGVLMLADEAPLQPFLPLLTAAQLSWVTRNDLTAVLWGKLLLNLNNALNALSDVPLTDELSQRAFRRCLALCQREALAVYRVAGIRPARLTAVPASWLPAVLSTPDALFRRIARPLLAIDPLARSSMWEDLQRGRATEVFWIQGEIVRLAQAWGLTAPVNAQVMAWVQAAEQGQTTVWTGEALWAALSPLAKTSRLF